MATADTPTASSRNERIASRRASGARDSKETTTTEQELIDFCRQHLARFKCPDAVEFGDLPKTSTGKVQKYVLREKEWAGYDRRIH